MFGFLKSNRKDSMSQKEPNFPMENISHTSSISNDRVSVYEKTSEEERMNRNRSKIGFVSSAPIQVIKESGNL
jgi:hypothetical protein